MKQPIKNAFRWDVLHADKTIIAPTSEDFIFVSPKKLIGIEVEVENVGSLPGFDPNFWYTKEDGSLRNHGIEFISKPICGNQITAALNWLFHQYLPLKAQFTERTSIHIHVNMRDSSQNTLLNILILYIVFERLFYKFAGPIRYKNIFCVPVQETKLPIAVANYLVYQSLMSLTREWQKYSGLNLAPLRQFGTVEYRHMQGHRDIKYLLTWINLLFRLHKYAKKHEFILLFNNIQTLNTTSAYEEFVKSVFKEDAHHLLTNTLQPDMESGVSTVKTISLPSPFIKNLLAQIKNESDLLKALNISTTSVKSHEIKPESIWGIPDGVQPISIDTFYDQSLRTR